MVVVRFIGIVSGEVYWRCEWRGLLIVIKVRYICRDSSKVYWQCEW